MKGARVTLLLVALAIAAVVSASAPEPAPSPESRVCVPDKWQALSFTAFEGKRKMVLAKSAVDVDSDKAASEFIVFGGHHHHHHGHHHHDHHDHDHHHHDDHHWEASRAELAPKFDDDRVESQDYATLAKYHHGKGKGVVKIIADFAKEKVYITFHKSTGNENVTFCKVKDFDHPADLSSMLCLPERAKKAGTIVVGGSLDVDMYFFKAHRAIVEVSLASENNFPVAVNAVKKCHKGGLHTAYFNITKDIDEGFFDVPASCGGKLEGDLPSEVAHVLKHQNIVGNPAAVFLGGADFFDNIKPSKSQGKSLFGKMVRKVTSFWHGMSESSTEVEHEGAFVSSPKLRMYGQA